MKEIYDTLNESVLLDEEFDDWAEETDLVNDLVDKFNNIIKQEEEN
tara:strand:+ start:1759 stop:1896 length:138 start_codon:yes stop_codon:yes gene_type:complete